LALVFGVAVGACRPANTPPTLFEDLGTEDRPLLPTGGAWQDPAIVEGSAEWVPFRKPGAAAPAAAVEEPSAAAGGAIDGELRGLLVEFNDLLAAGKTDEAAEYLIQEQVEPCKNVFDLLPKFTAKLTEFAEALPGDHENLKKLSQTLSPATVLKLDVKEIQSKGESEAIAGLTGAPDSVQVRFLLVKEEGGDPVWYIDHPQIRVMSQALPAMEQALTRLDTLIAGIKSGEIAGDALAQQAAAIDQMLQGLMPAEPEPPAGEN